MVDFNSEYFTCNAPGAPVKVKPISSDAVASGTFAVRYLEPAFARTECPLAPAKPGFHASLDRADAAEVSKNLFPVDFAPGITR